MMDLKQYYNDPKFSGSFAGKHSFYRALKKDNVAVKKSDIDRYLKSDDAYTLHKPNERPKRFRRVYTKGIGYLYQIDLCDMSALAEQNKGYKWIINVMDTFSKKLWAYKTKNKKGNTITNILRHLLTSNTPIKLETDDGKEFKNTHFRALLRRLKIKTYSISSDRKCALIERLNRTLKTRMYRAFTARGSHTWYDILDNLVNGYNNSYHRSIKCTPNEVNHSNEAVIRSRLFPPEKPRLPPKLNVGASVRITRKKSIFRKVMSNPGVMRYFIYLK